MLKILKEELQAMRGNPANDDAQNCVVDCLLMAVQAYEVDAIHDWFDAEDNGLKHHLLHFQEMIIQNR